MGLGPALEFGSDRWSHLDEFLKLSPDSDAPFPHEVRCSKLGEYKGGGYLAGQAK